MCHGDDTYKTCFVILLSERHLNLRFAVLRKSNKKFIYLSRVKRFRETVHPAKNTGSMLAFCIWKNYNIREMDPGKGARAAGPRRVDYYEITLPKIGERIIITTE